MRDSNKTKFLDNVKNTYDDERFVEYFRDYLANRSIHSVRNKKTTIKQFRNFLDEYHPDTDFWDVSTKEVNDWKNELDLQDYAPRSVRGKMYNLSTVFRYGVKMKLIEENPIRGLDELTEYGVSLKDGKSSKDEEFLSVQQYKKIEDTCHKIRDKLVVQLLWTTGIRPSELVQIQIDDIDHEERSIEIINAKTPDREPNSRRVVYYPYSVKRTIDIWLHQGERDAYLRSDESNYLLLTETFDRMHVNRVTEICDERARDAGVQKVLYEDVNGEERRWVNATLFRTSHASQAVKNGIPIVYLSKLMGHEDIETTRDNYIHLKDDDTKDVARKYCPT